MKQRIKILEKNIDLFYKRLESCDLCPRDCKVNRLKGKKGYCGVTDKIKVYTHFLHQGEEPGITAKSGSGTIFFSGCSLKCIYCQNYKFSHFTDSSHNIDVDQLAAIMLELQESGAANINLVTPTHFLPFIVEGLFKASVEGLNIPIVYNTSGYEKPQIIEFVSKIVDVYLTDMKYFSQEISKEYSSAKNYPEYNQKSILTMYKTHKQVKWDDHLLEKGLVIRHLILPNYVQDTLDILSWIAKNTGKALLSLMSQYQPYFKAKQYLQLNRPIKVKEYDKVIAFLQELNLDGWVQDLETKESLAGVHFKK